MSGTPFVSTLSTGGFLALAGAGFRPLGTVQGNSVVSFGYQQRPRSRRIRGLSPRWIEGVGSPRGGGGASTLYYPKGSEAAQQYLNEGGWFAFEGRTAAYNDARTNALERLGAAAREAGAVAVVDVQLRRGRFGRTEHAIEFTALGTAVTSDRFEPEENDPVPIVSLSGTEFWKLVEAGVWPLGVVGGSCVGFVMSGFRTKFARNRLTYRSRRNQEFVDYTDGLRTARLQAAGRLRREATKLGASGVVGVSVDRELKEQRDDNLLVTIDLLGTAVAPLEHSAPPSVACALGLGKA
ncbi:MAG TPA: heavy metal-binding domain-containing protein [Gaiellaceae bacterium]|jgi:uncharacterized protein YbjQ (UPF0145 family)